MKTHLPQSIPQAREIIPVPCSGTCTCTCVHPYGIEAHNYIVDVVGGWLIERYLNVVQWSVETECFGPWSVISCEMHRTDKKLNNY